MGKCNWDLLYDPGGRGGRGGWGCGAERRQWRMQRGGASVAVEKIEQASSAKIFSGTARRWGQMRLRLPWERICAQYGFRFFIQEKSKFVSSTVSDRKGLVKGEAVPLDRILVPFVRTKGTPPRRAVLTMPLQKAPRRRRQDEIWCERGSRCAGAGLRLAEEFRRQAATPSAFYRIQQKCRRTQTNVCNLRGDVLH